jgi:hypothetical protein
MCLLICSDNQACSVESFCHGRRLKRQICAGKSTANSKQPAHLLSRLFHSDGGGWEGWEKEGKEGMDQVHGGRGQGERRRHRAHTTCPLMTCLSLTAQQSHASSGSASIRSACRSGGAALAPFAAGAPQRAAAPIRCGISVLVHSCSRPAFARPAAAAAAAAEAVAVVRGRGAPGSCGK